MKQIYIFSLQILFTLLFLPFAIGMFKGVEGGFGSVWDALSFIIVIVTAILLFLMTFNYTKNSSKNFFIYKLIWLQEMFIISGLFGTIIGFAFTIIAMDSPVPGVDPTNELISNMAISLITLIYGFVGALIIYMVQKFVEMKDISNENEEIKIVKPKEGFLLSSFIYFFLFLILSLGIIYIGSSSLGGSSALVPIECLYYIVIVLIILILFYNGDSFINLMKNIFWYLPNTEKNIVYNLKYIRNMKKIVAMIICVSLLIGPITMLIGMLFPSETEILGLNVAPFIGLKNGALQFLWILDFIILLTIIEGREVSKLYFETGKINAGDRFYSLKYILGPAFLIFFTFSFGIILSFIVL